MSIRSKFMASGAVLALTVSLASLPIAATADNHIPKMKMTTPIPEGIETPNTMETHLGTLTSFDGVPDKETTQKIYDDLDLRRATEAFLAALPIASMAAMVARRRGRLFHTRIFI